MLVALLLVAQQPRTVTFTQPCAHSSVVLEALGKEMGVAIKPGGSVLQDYFALKFTDRPVEDVKRVIAETLNAEWVQRGEYLVLDRGPKQHNKEFEDDQSALRSEIEKYLSAQPPPSFDKGVLRDRMVDAIKIENNDLLWQREVNEIRKLNPRANIGQNVVRSIGVDALLSVQVNEPRAYWLFADGRTDMPAQMQQAIRDYAAEKEEFQDLVASLGSDKLSMYLGLFRPGEPSDFSVSIVRTPGSIRVDLHEVISGPGRASVLSMGMIASFNRPTPNPASPFKPTLSGKLPLSDAAASYLRVVRSSMTGYPPSQSVPSPEDLETVRRLATELPENDPLTVFGDAPLREMGAQSGLDYVALIPDRQALEGSWVVDVERREMSSVWTSWSWEQLIDQDKSTGILILRPRDPKEERLNRFDRTTASRFIAAFLARRHVSLEALLAMASHSDSPRQFKNDLGAARRFLPIGTPRYGDWVALKTLASLGAAQRRQAEEAGVTIRWGELPTSVRSEIENRFFSSATTFSSAPVERVDWNTVSGTSHNSLSTPVVSRVERVPDSSTARLVVLSNTLFRPAPTTSLMVPSALTAEILGIYKSMAHNDGMSDFNRVALANARRVHMELNVAGVGFTYFSAQVDDTTLDSEYFTLDKLPEPFKAQLAEAIKRAGGGQ